MAKKRKLKLKKFRVWGVVTGSKYLGTFEAETPVAQEQSQGGK